MGDTVAQLTALLTHSSSDLDSTLTSCAVCVKFACDNVDFLSHLKGMWIGIGQCKLPLVAEHGEREDKMNMYGG